MVLELVLLELKAHKAQYLSACGGGLELVLLELKAVRGRGDLSKPGGLELVLLELKDTYYTVGLRKVASLNWSFWN